MQWTVTTTGLAERSQTHEHADPRSAFDDYYAQTSQLYAAGYVHDGDEAVIYGRRWSRSFLRGTHRVTVRLDAPVR
jgi:hypothetical protein